MEGRGLSLSLAFNQVDPPLPHPLTPLAAAAAWWFKATHTLILLHFWGLQKSELGLLRLEPGWSFLEAPAENLFLSSSGS